jgi:hypothetical protein
MKVYCIECNRPIEVNISQISDSYIPPDLCTCDNCSQEKETDPGIKKWEVYLPLQKSPIKSCGKKNRKK